MVELRGSESVWLKLLGMSDFLERSLLRLIFFFLNWFRVSSF